ncbi:MobH family relaxase [Pseudoduganella violacea]|uniref:Conjugal transfer pilus assembly protein TraI n=1 Tax=Pseudoduganella violacea TaxID=1715466 RepID=A0A7W5BFI2_9BURK|nr:MobH family relaxase [Pseudoduganella violacea]MBB3122189.1 conjugal transfer pilus assembly protein TraI [Pseudoduganella violacea]
MHRFSAFLARARSIGAASVPAAPAVDPAPAQDTASVGMAAQSVEAMLAEHADLIGRIKLCYGSDPATFAADLLAPIRGYLYFVNALPATPDSYFSGAGGLARLGLETAFFALQATDAQIFAGRLTISHRRRLEPRWRRAAFLAGLCAELHRTLSQVAVYDEGDGCWQPYLTPLTRWLEQRQLARLRVRWNSGPETRMLGLFALPMIVPAATMADLAEGNTVIVPQMLASIAGTAMYHEHNVMDRLVRHAAVLVINRNLRAEGDGAGARKPPVYLARHVIDVVRELVVTHQAWQPNIGRSRLWFGRDGLFMVWPNGLADIIRRLDDERLPGVPQSPDAMLAMLVAAGLVASREGQGAVLAIWPPGVPEPLDAIRFVSAGTILAVLSPQPEPLDGHLAGRAPPQAHAEPARGAPGDASPSPAPAPAPAPAPSAAPPEPYAPCEPCDLGEPCDPGEPFERFEPTPAPAPPARPGKGAPAKEADTQLRLPAIAISPGPVAEDEHGSRAAAAAEAAPPTLRRPRKPRQRNAVSGDLVLQATHGLKMPLRLNPTVAAALQAIATAPDAPSLRTQAGLFIPLPELAARGLDARQALRALADADMLALQADGEAIQTRVIQGVKRPGLLIAPQFMVPDAAATPGEGDAAAPV